MTDILDRFLRYARINTRSDEEVTDRTPSTENQWELGKLLEKELKDLGLEDVTLTGKCFVYATLPANGADDAPVIGLLAHMDTSPDFNAEGVNPQIIENYDGGDISLEGKKGMLLSPDEFPVLKMYKGQTLITTDGTTLLGADDKAGIAAIMDALEYLVNHPEVKHGRIRIAFTPDEETSYGIGNFDVDGFGADFAFTLDGGQIGEMEYETFNAARAYVTVHGKSVHPGDAKDVMINAMRVFFEFDCMLPEDDRPEHTEGREGFFHLWKMTAGSVEEVEAAYLLRDHDTEKFDGRKEMVAHCADFLNKKYGEGTVSVRIQEKYRNMREVIEPVIHIVETAQEAMRELGIEPISHPIRGGTDGARLSFEGLPTPNIFNGGHNFHGPYEFLPLESMQKASQVIVRILEKYAKQEK
jgi:tripeptide aminopeptidase